MRGVNALVLSSAVALGIASTPAAASLVINTDSSWLATSALPASTWNTDATFDATGWSNAVVVIPACAMGVDCIWYDHQFSATQFAWLRKTFTIADPITTGFLSGGVDDDADVYVNGMLVLSDHNGFAQNFGPIDVTSFLVQGVNLIAVALEDNVSVHGQNHAFAMSLQIEQQQIPEPVTLVLFGIALAGLAFRRRRPALNLAALPRVS